MGGPGRARGRQAGRHIGGRPDQRNRRGFGFGFGGFAGRFPGHGPAVRRGDVRSAILALLAEEPMHGYQVIQELAERSGGMWRPSAGSIYPTLQQLEDEGLVRAEERDGRRVFTLTDSGREQATRSASSSSAPWDVAGADEGQELRELFFQVAAATKQVADVGTPEVLGRARQILVETRRSLYRLLAEDDATISVAGKADDAPSR
jgi:DNA-binding PadR family transcriptional regulator